MYEGEALRIRDATVSDREAIRTLTLAAYAEYATAMPPQLWAGYQRNALETLVDVGSTEQMVAERAGTLVGTVLLFPPTANAYSGVADAPTWPEVRLLAVDPAARGQGIGHALMRECMRRAQLAGATALSLHTADIMQSAMRLYLSMGFQRTPEHDFRPAEGVLIKGFILLLAQP